MNRRYLDPGHRPPTRDGGRSRTFCRTCHGELAVPDMEDTIDCGGRCLGCVREAEGRDRLDGLWPGSSDRVTAHLSDLMAMKHPFIHHMFDLPEDAGRGDVAQRTHFSEEELVAGLFGLSGRD